jgi:hypothetical protein
VAPLRAQAGPGGVAPAALPWRRCSGGAARVAPLVHPRSLARPMARPRLRARPSSPRTTGPRSTFPLPGPLHARPGPPLLRRRTGTRPGAPRGGAPRLLRRGAGPGGLGGFAWGGKGGGPRGRGGGDRVGPGPDLRPTLRVRGGFGYRGARGTDHRHERGGALRRCSEEVLYRGAALPGKIYALLAKR